jgi:hypothetical protein
MKEMVYRTEGQKRVELLHQIMNAAAYIRIKKLNWARLYIENRSKHFEQLT